jgi:hypothetical protein
LPSAEGANKRDRIGAPITAAERVTGKPLAQSMARELAPKGIHVAHFVIDGGVRNAEKGRV